MKFYFGEDNIRLIQLLDVAAQVVSELLEGGVERHLVHGSRQLGAPGARVGHHPGVLKEGKVRGWQQQQFYLLAASLSVIVSILYSKLGCGDRRRGESIRSRQGRVQTGETFGLTLHPEER